jgi:hypothetical protein
MNHIVRPARLEDAATLIDFNAAMALETEHLTLDRATLAAGVKAALADANKARYFVAEIDGRIVGMLMLTLEWSTGATGRSGGGQGEGAKEFARRRCPGLGCLHQGHEKSPRSSMMFSDACAGPLVLVPEKANVTAPPRSLG